MFGIGLMLPILAVVTTNNINLQYPYLNIILEFLNNPSKTEILIAGFIFLKFIFILHTNKLQANFTTSISEDLAKRLFNGFINMPYNFHLNINTSSIIHMVNGEVAMFTTVSQAIMILLTETCVIIGVALTLIYIEPIASFIVIIFMATAAFLFYKFTKKRLSKWGLEQQLIEKLLYQNLIQSLHGIKDVKIYNVENYFIDFFNRTYQRKSIITSKYTRMLQFPRVYLELLAIISITILVIVMVIQNRNLSLIIPTILKVL